MRGPFLGSHFDHCYIVAADNMTPLRSLLNPTLSYPPLSLPHAAAKYSVMVTEIALSRHAWSLDPLALILTIVRSNICRRWGGVRHADNRFLNPYQALPAYLWTDRHSTIIIRPVEAIPTGSELRMCNISSKTSKLIIFVYYLLYYTTKNRADAIAGRPNKAWPCP